MMKKNIVMMLVALGMTSVAFAGPVAEAEARLGKAQEAKNAAEAARDAKVVATDALLANIQAVQLGEGDETKVSEVFKGEGLELGAALTELKKKAENQQVKEAINALEKRQADADEKNTEFTAAQTDLDTAKKAVEEAKTALKNRIKLADGDAKTKLEADIDAAKEVEDVNAIENDQANKDAFNPKSVEKSDADKLKEANEEIEAAVKATKDLQAQAEKLAERVKDLDDKNEIKAAVKAAVEAAKKDEHTKFEAVKAAKADAVTVEEVNKAKEVADNAKKAQEAVAKQANIVLAKVVLHVMIQKLEKSEVAEIKTLVEEIKTLEAKDKIEEAAKKLVEGEALKADDKKDAKALVESALASIKDIKLEIAGPQEGGKYFTVRNGVIATVVIAALCEVKAIYSKWSAMKKVARVKKQEQPGIVAAAQQTVADQYKAVARFFGFGKKAKTAEATVVAE